MTVTYKIPYTYTDPAARCRYVAYFEGSIEGTEEEVNRMLEAVLAKAKELRR